MTKDERKKIEEQDIMEEMEEEIEDIEDEEWNIDEDKLEDELDPHDDLEEDEIQSDNSEEDKTQDILARTLADFENFKKRVERDKQDMIFFLKQDIFKKILPRIDDLERIIKNTPEDMQNGALFEWILAMKIKLKQDLETLWLKGFDSVWELVDHNKHDVMTTVPWKEEWVIIDEFERWYILWDRILRHAKVVVGAWSDG